jgi:cell division protein FtsL
MVKQKTRRGGTFSQKSKKAGAPPAARGGLMLLLPFTAIVFMVLSFVWGRVHVSQLAARIGRLEQDRQQLIDRNEKLLIQLERLSSYGRISQIAAARSGLRQVRPQYLIVEK